MELIKIGQRRREASSKKKLVSKRDVPRKLSPVKSTTKVDKD